MQKYFVSYYAFAKNEKGHTGGMFSSIECCCPKIRNIDQIRALEKKIFRNKPLRKHLKKFNPDCTLIEVHILNFIKL